MNSGLAGFHNAPLTKIVLFSSAVISFLAVPRGNGLLFGLSQEAIFREKEMWRLITSHVVFKTMPEIFIGGFLLYSFRTFERQIGSNKHTVFVLFSMAVSSALQLSFLFLLPRETDWASFSLASGPYAAIFASFVPFFFDIPSTSMFTTFGFQFSQKVLLYVAGLQVVFASGLSSIVPALSGILAGLLYRSNFLCIRKAKFPDSMAAHFSWLNSPRPSLHSHRPSPRQQAGQGGADRVGRGGQASALERLLNAPVTPPTRLAAVAPPLAPRGPPDEDALHALLSMGFDRTAAVRALAVANNDVTLASNILVESQMS